MSGPNPHMTAVPRTAPQFRAQADLQRSIARGYNQGKKSNPELGQRALKRADYYDAKARALENGAIA